MKIRVLKDLSKKINPLVASLSIIAAFDMSASVHAMDWFESSSIQHKKPTYEDFERYFRQQDPTHCPRGNQIEYLKTAFGLLEADVSISDVNIYLDSGVTNYDILGRHALSFKTYFMDFENAKKAQNQIDEDFQLALKMSQLWNGDLNPVVEEKKAIEEIKPVIEEKKEEILTQDWNGVRVKTNFLNLYMDAIESIKVYMTKNPLETRGQVFEWVNKQKFNIEGQSVSLTENEFDKIYDLVFNVRYGKAIELVGAYMQDLPFELKTDIKAVFDKFPDKVDADGNPNAAGMFIKIKINGEDRIITLAEIKLIIDAIIG